MFDSVEIVSIVIEIMVNMFEIMIVNEYIMMILMEIDFLNVIELVDYLVSKGVFFRKVYEIVGKLVLECSKNGFYL